jgi:hypothetical protein
MRTVEQVKKELETARVEALKCQKVVERLEQEMKEIYLAAKQALGIEDKPTYRHDASIGGDGNWGR